MRRDLREPKLRSLCRSTPAANRLPKSHKSLHQVEERPALHENFQNWRAFDTTGLSISRAPRLLRISVSTLTRTKMPHASRFSEAKVVRACFVR
jgi:hypothetical protein